jgi:sulfofructose kinase
VERDVVGLGFSCMDDLLLLSEIPPGEGRATILRRERQGGGMAATAMVAVARLGGQAGFVAKVGDDAVGDQVLEEFRRYGVDVSRAVTVSGARSHLTVVLVDRRTGERAFLTQRGNVPELTPDDLDRAYLTGAKIVHLSDAGPAALRAAQWAKEAGREVGFDGTHFQPTIFTLAPYVDYLIVSRFFASEFVAHQEGRDLGRFARDFAALAADAAGSEPPAGAPVHHDSGEVEQLHGERLLDAAHRLRAMGPPVVVVTEGEHGCWCDSPEGDLHVPAYPMQPVDTTGAGDVFHGAFMLARAWGWELPRCLRLASATAALKCRALGGRSGIPTLDEALALVDRAS